MRMIEGSETIVHESDGPKAEPAKAEGDSEESSRMAAAAAAKYPGVGICPPTGRGAVGGLLLKVEGAIDLSRVTLPLITLNGEPC